jgi:DNA-binding MarR family transcriptional regulator
MKKESITEVAERVADVCKLDEHEVSPFVHGFREGFEYSQQEISELKNQRDEMLQMLGNSNDYLKDLINEYGVDSSEINNHVSKLEQLIKKVKNE